MNFDIPSKAVEHGLANDGYNRSDVKEGGFWYAYEGAAVSAHAVKCLKQRYYNACQEDHDAIVPIHNMTTTSGPSHLKGFENASCLVPGHHCPAQYMWGHIIDHLTETNRDAWDNKEVTQGMILKSIHAHLTSLDDVFDDLAKPEDMQAGVSVSSMLTQTEDSDGSECLQDIEKVEEDQKEREV